MVLFPRPRYRPTGKCSLYRYETTGQLLHSEIGSNQVGCSCTWQGSLSCETNTGVTEEVPAPNQSWRGWNHPTSNWPYQGHQIPYLVPRTANRLLSGVPDFFDRNKILSGYDLSHYQVPHCIRVLFYFVWFVFIHHNFQFYFKLCTFWILLIIFCFIWSYWIIYFLTCLEVFWGVVS